MKKFVTLSKEEFESCLPKGHFTVSDPWSMEYIYEVRTDKANLNVRIFSTVDMKTNTTREKDSDAIRIVFWDTKNERPIGKAKKILRVKGTTDIKERIASRIKEFLDNVGDIGAIDFDYVKAILNHSMFSKSDFAASLLEQLDRKKFLSDSQLSYILGKNTPKGNPTFEQQVKEKFPYYLKQWFDYQKEDIEKTGQDMPENLDSEAENRAVAESKNKTNGFIPTLKKIDTEIFTPTKQYKPYKYKFKEFNPVQSATIPLIEKDCNLIIGAKTSAGKTICAEFVMDYVLKQGKRIIYLSPLKALTQEKYDDWNKRFSKETITILTGDYVLSEKMMKQLAESTIIVMTSEMLDSRTRKMKAEKNYWLREVGLIICDESHIITTDRGHPVETGLMRFTKINPKARVIFLSATMPNLSELASWLNNLNGKETEIIESEYRPVELQTKYLEYVPTTIGGYGNRPDYWAIRKMKIDMAINAVMEKPTEKFLIFVHDKGTGRSIVKALTEKEERVYFHNADLDLTNRLEIEEQFKDKDNGLRILVSTSTLAWGRNLPARNVVVVGIHRGIQEVDELDIVQMAGRAGRYGIDDAGFVNLIIPYPEKERWASIFQQCRPITSVLRKESILMFHILAEINNGEIYDEKSLIEWYKRSLAYMQGNLSDVNGAELFHRLEQIKMINQDDSGKVTITNLGKVSAMIYYDPYDIYSWYMNFSCLWPDFHPIIERQFLPTNDFTLAWALSEIPTFNWNYLPKDVDVYGISSELQKLFYPHIHENNRLRTTNAIQFVLAAYNCLQGIEAESDTIRTNMRQIQYDCYRMIEAIKMIDSLYAKWNKKVFLNSLKERIKYGIPEEMVPLVRLKGIGGKRAKDLWDIGIHSLEDVSNPKNKRKISNLFNPGMWERIKEEADSILRKERKRGRKRIEMEEE